MEQVADFFTGLLDTSYWPPRWICGEWSDFHGWLYILSDLAIWGAYFLIPLFLIRFIEKKPGVPLPTVFWLFGAFILLCGLTHLLDAIMFYWPAYRLNGLIRFFTAIISWATVIALAKFLPQALKLKTSDEFEKALKDRELAEKLILEKNEELSNINRIMVDRELKIKELKEEINRLENQG